MVPFRLRKAITPLLAICAILLAGCGGAEARHQRHMARGMEYFAAESFAKARVEFGNALQIDPNNAQARYMSGRVAERLGNLRDAAGFYQGAIDIDSGHVEARTNLARMLVFAGAPERALELLEPVFKANAADPEALAARGAARSQLRDLAGALGDAELATRVAPNNDNAVALLASLYRQTSQSERAMVLVQQALQKRPKSVELRQVLAQMYLSDGNRLGAAEQLRKVIELRPGEPAYRHQLVMLLTNERELGQAEEVLVEGIEDFPGTPEFKLAHAGFLVAQVSPNRGEEVLRRYIAEAPQDFELQLGLGAMQERAANTKLALATYQQIASSAGEQRIVATAKNRIATVHLREGRADEAARLLAEVLTDNPRDNDALLLRGNIALDRHDPASAIADLRAVLREQPDAVGVMRVLARAHLSNGEPALAEETLRDALNVAPRDTGVQIELAQVLLQSGKAELAITLLENAVRAEPDEPSMRSALVRSYVAAGDMDAARAGAADLVILQPDRPTGHFLSGVVASAEGKHKEAEAHLLRSLEREPAGLDALAALAAILISTGRTTDASRLLADFVKSHPDNAVARNLLGEAKLASRDQPGAIEEFKQVVKMTPRWPVGQRNLALAFLAQGDRASALAVYERGVIATNYDAALVVDFAALLEQDGNSHRAIELYDRLYASNSRLELAANNLAMLLVTYRDDADSLDRARDLTAAFADSDNGALLDTYGWVRFKRGEIPAALTALERAAKLAPQSRVVRYHLAMTQLKSGERDKARRSLEFALADAANFAGIEEARSALKDLQRGRG
jgi:tetratricopeptide (TPR) repeat protein